MSATAADDPIQTILEDIQKRGQEARDMYAVFEGQIESFRNGPAAQALPAVLTFAARLWRSDSATRREQARDLEEAGLTAGLSEVHAALISAADELDALADRVTMLSPRSDT